MTREAPAAVRDAILQRFPEARSIEGAAWVVGGVLRDVRLGRHSPDIDIAAAGAETIAGSFARRWSVRLITLGRERFASWRVVVSGRRYDFAELTRGSIEADLGRRDFTINAMAMPLHGEAEWIDPWGGAEDLERRLVRTVAPENLEDDPLRILKGVRMVAVLGFGLDSATAVACRRLAPRLRDVAPERIAAELELILSQGEPRLAAEALEATAAGEVVFGRPIPPLFSRIPAGDAPLGLAAIFRSDPSELKGETLRLPGSLVGAAAAILELDQAIEEARSDGQLDVLLYDFGEETARRVVALRRSAGDGEIARRLEARVEARGGELAALEPLLTGLEIAEIAGVSPGPRLGALKRELTLAQVRREVTTRSEAVTWVSERAE